MVALGGEAVSCDRGSPACLAWTISRGSNILGLRNVIDSGLVGSIPVNTLPGGELPAARPRHGEGGPGEEGLLHVDVR
jgi:hypothetical protein